MGKTMMKLLSCLVLFGLLSVGCSSSDSDENDDFGNYGDGTTHVRPDDIILFEDTVPHDICVNLWDTNGDGQLSYREAAAVKSIGLNFKGNEQMRHFKELRYFTGLTSIQDEAFYHCDDLRTIEIPKNVTSIGNSAFCWCSSLTSITIPSSITSIENSTFRGCSNLTSVTIPNNVETIEAAAFQICSKLATVTFEKGSKLKTIGGEKGMYGISYYGAFSGCTSLTSITIPASVETIKVAAFQGCSELATVTFEKGSKLKTIEEGGYDYYYCYGAFCDLKSLQEVDMSACTQVESIGNFTFYHDNNLQLFKIGTATPPKCNQWAFGGISSSSILKVPSGCVDAYKKASEWNRFASITELDK